MEKKITGVMIYYYAVCKRKLWYFYHEIQMEHGNENVALGKVIDEETYQRDDKHINIDNVINIDFIRTKGVLHEIKKSDKIEEASILQVKYYLYYLKQRDVVVKAKIDYPLLKECVDVELSEADEREIADILAEIEEIVDAPLPPAMKKQRICRSCAYCDLCFI